MIKNLRLVTGDSEGEVNKSAIHFDIEKKFSLDKSTHNTLTLEIITVNNEKYVFQKQLTFLKDGEQGSNGTDYSCIVYPCDSNGIARTGFYPLYNASEDILGSQQYIVQVYKNGQQVDKDSYSVQWSVNQNAPFTLQGADQAQCSLTLKNELNANMMNQSVLKVQVNINFSTDLKNSVNQKLATYETKKAAYDEIKDNYNEKNNTHKKIKQEMEEAEIAWKNAEVEWKSSTSGTSIHYILPIPIALFNCAEMIKTQTESLDYLLPSNIEYDASGYNPTFVDKFLKFCYNTIDWNITSENSLCSLYAEPIRNEDGSLKVNEEEKIEYDLTKQRLKPANRYMGDSGHCVLLLADQENRKIYYPIVTYLNTYGNEAINGWDGTSIEMGEKNGTILAPQIGAGVKHSDNTFSGVLMGSVQESGKFSQGLYGFDKGVKTFGLEAESGNAWFGPGKAIEITSSTGVIRGNPKDITNNTCVMILDLFGNDAGNSTKAIHVQTANEQPEDRFYVTYAGNCYIKGTGEIGNWVIGDSLAGNSDPLRGCLYSKYADGKKEKQIVLNPNDGSITGAELRAQKGGIKLTGFMELPNGGYFGELSSGVPGVQESGIGLAITIEKEIAGSTEKTSTTSEIKATGANAGMRCNNAYFTANDNNSISFGISGGGFTIRQGTSGQSELVITGILAVDQYGIYARFA